MDELQRQLESLTEVVNSALLLRECESSRKLMFFIKRLLRQMRLENEWHASEILIEAYLRTRDQVQAGKAIRNPPSYLMSVAHNVVREKKREQQRHHGIQKKLANTLNAVSLPETNYQDAVNCEVVNSLWTSFNTLSDRDRQILDLRIVKGYQWSEIASILVEHGIEEHYGKALIAKLRKQGERALERLRKASLSVHDS